MSLKHSASLVTWDTSRSIIGLEESCLISEIRLPWWGSWGHGVSANMHKVSDQWLSIILYWQIAGVSWNVKRSMVKISGWLCTYTVPIVTNHWHFLNFVWASIQLILMHVEHLDQYIRVRLPSIEVIEHKVSITYLVIGPELLKLVKGIFVNICNECSGPTAWFPDLEQGSSQLQCSDTR